MSGKLSLLCLPDKVLKTIVERCGTYKQIAGLCPVCRKFDSIARHVIMAALLHLERCVKKHSHVLRREMEVCSEKAQISTTSHALCLHQFNMLLLQLRLLAVCTWGYMTSGICSVIYGQVLDSFYSVFHTLRYDHHNMMPSITEYMQHTIYQVMKVLHEKLECRLVHCSEEQFIRFRIVLPGITFVKLLEVCLIDGTTLKTLETEDRIFKFHSIYNLEGCWMCVRWADCEGELKGQDILQLCLVLRDLVWMLNTERIDALLQNFIATNDGDITSLTSTSTTKVYPFYALEECNPKYFYGHKESRSGTYELPQLTITIDLTCDLQLLPFIVCQETSDPLSHISAESFALPDLFFLKISLKTTGYSSGSSHSATYIYTSK